MAFRNRNHSNGSGTFTGPFHRVKAAAELTGLKVPTLRAWMARRKIGHVKLGRAVRIPQSEINRIMREGTVAPRG